MAAIEEFFRAGARGGGGGAHFGGPSVGIPGGGHVNFRGGAAAAAGLIGYGAYEAAEMEDAVWQLIYHSGQEQNAGNRDKFRKILQDAMTTSGYGVHDIAESAKQEIRMFQGTPGGGLDVLPEMLRAATIESRLKGESPEELMKALIGLAHMTKQYSPEDIKKLAPAFAFLSTANPGSLSSIERAAGYAVPLLQSGLEIDPMQSLLLGTALTRAGATSTKSGTWLREMALRAMPGTSLMSKMAFKKHEFALHDMGLVDDADKPTWFTDGKPDLLKMLDIAGEHAQRIPLTKRAAIERSLFGAQGGGGFALLADPAVREQVQSLGKEMNSTEFKNRYAGFTESYQQGSTLQNARTAMQEFNVAMMDIGAHTLPAVNGMLKDFKALMEGIRDILPKPIGGNASAGNTILKACGGRSSPRHRAWRAVRRRRRCSWCRDRSRHGDCLRNRRTIYGQLPPSKERPRTRSRKGHRRCDQRSACRTRRRFPRRHVARATGPDQARPQHRWPHLGLDDERDHGPHR